MRRNDGSIDSANNPIWGSRYQVRDFGLYRGVVRDVLYIDHESNNSGNKKANEVVYNVVIIGGDRDGQLFNNARLMKTLGGHANFEEVTLKKVEGVTQLDPANSLAQQLDLSLANMDRWNGDVVYVQFLNGDPLMPVIVGLGYHQAAKPEAVKNDGPLYKRKFNGIYQEITKDGEFTWSKDNGAYVPYLLNSKDPLYPFVSEFAPLPGQEQAVKVTLDNKYAFKFEYLLGLNVSIDGVADKFAFTTTSGVSLKLNGLATDSFTVDTVLGTKFKVEGGASDAITLGTSVGATIKVDGLGDEISLKTALGDVLSVSAASGIQASTPTGTSLSMKNGAVEIASVGKASLVLDKTGFIKLGNATGDALKILGELLQTLSTETAAGFGAPLTSVALYAKLMAQLKLITG